MMPTMSAASTPSRRAIRNAETNETPVVSNLQLQCKCTALAYLRQPDQTSPLSSHQDGFSDNSTMTALVSRRFSSLVLSLLLPFTQALAQELAPASAGPSEQSQLHAPPRPDPKRAQKAAERGEKAESEGRIADALAAYAEAAQYAPQDAAILERGAALRSRLVRGYVEAAERDALAGHLDQATEELAAALQIDPGNGIVAERLTQFKAMEDESPARRTTEISGLPRLQPQSGKRNLNLRGDTKTVYQQTAELFGVKAAFR